MLAPHDLAAGGETFAEGGEGVNRMLGQDHLRRRRPFRQGFDHRLLLDRKTVKPPRLASG
jgi:hypothetical protein